MATPPTAPPAKQTAADSLAEVKSSIQIVYCANCGHTDAYLSQKLAEMKQKPMCPVCHRTQEFYDTIESDPRLGGT